METNTLFFQKDFMSSCDEFAGYITLLKRDYAISIRVPWDEGLSGAKIETEWRLKQKLNQKISLIEQRLKASDNVEAFLQEFKLVAETCLKDTVDESTHSLSAHSNKVLQEISVLGWDKVSTIDDSFSKIELCVHDDGGRRHIVKVQMTLQDPSLAPVCTTELPEKFEFRWSAKAGLNHLYKQFEIAVNSYQHFWDTMRDIDENCWVLEPQNPPFSSNQRRLAISPTSSLHITVNCKQPTTLPECRLLGAEAAKTKLKENLNTNLNLWDLERSLLNNLKEVLDVEFPSPATTSIEELNVDCGICCCHDLEGEIPDVVCERTLCSQAFHRTCLCEWLRSLSARQSSRTLFGECPLCLHSLQVKVPDD